MQGQGIRTSYDPPICLACTVGKTGSLGLGSRLWYVARSLWEDQTPWEVAAELVYAGRALRFLALFGHRFGEEGQEHPDEQAQHAGHGQVHPQGGAICPCGA